MATKVVIMRGPSGSGKSTLAKEIYDNFAEPNKRLVSADIFFYEGGVYKFDPSKLKTCHQQCYHGYICACALSYSIKSECLIIVDNTNIRRWEFQPYVQVAEKLGYEVEYAVTPRPWNAELFAQRNTHGVPLEKIQQMIANFEEV